MKMIDIPDLPVLRFIQDLNDEVISNPEGAPCGTTHAGYPNSLQNVLGVDISRKLVLSKLKSLVKRGLVDACYCGCRGDIEITKKGRELVKELESNWP